MLLFRLEKSVKRMNKEQKEWIKNKKKKFNSPGHLIRITLVIRWFVAFLILFQDSSFNKPVVKDQLREWLK